MPHTEQAKLVLVVDDDAQTRESIRDALQRNRAIIAAVTDGRDALDFLEHDQPDAMIVNLELQSLKGSVLVHALRSVGVLDRIPVIALTSVRGGTLPVSGQGFACVLWQPVDLASLRAAVERSLAMSVLRD